MKFLSLALMVVGIISANLPIAACCIIAGALCGWAGGLFDPI